MLHLGDDLPQVVHIEPSIPDRHPHLGRKARGLEENENHGENDQKEIRQNGRQVLEHPPEEIHELARLYHLQDVKRIRVDIAGHEPVTHGLHQPVETLLVLRSVGRKLIHRTTYHRPEAREHGEEDDHYCEDGQPCGYTALGEPRHGGRTDNGEEEGKQKGDHERLRRLEPSQDHHRGCANE